MFTVVKIHRWNFKGVGSKWLVVAYANLQPV